ncbi:hypothetical protein DQ04_10671000 [Trypanosoma grayi]|uniref:hypothetical protein n=1 Tax=Trypanosoma grayi TaxID=71804 RepID=UPI0004F44686|nr:hypothetical protein DQ04_10671000 [Trypanosoma grayi]KEG07168.1 hypothetical protein DQ04_10671000 [Trypanosoma grayi]
MDAPTPFSWSRCKKRRRLAKERRGRRWPSGIAANAVCVSSLSVKDNITFSQLASFNTSRGTVAEEDKINDTALSPSSIAAAVIVMLACTMSSTPACSSSGVWSRAIKPDGVVPQQHDEVGACGVDSVLSPPCHPLGKPALPSFSHTCWSRRSGSRSRIFSPGKDGNASCFFCSCLHVAGSFVSALLLVSSVSSLHSRKAHRTASMDVSFPLQEAIRSMKK